MQCPDCDLSVLVEDGTITPHLRPDTLKRCTQAHNAAQHEEPTEKKPAAKAPAKTVPSKTKPHK